MKRVLCVWFPNFPLQRLLCRQPELKAQPCALYGQAGNRGIRIVACSREAMAEGVIPGMSLAEAQALMPAGHFVEYEASADVAVLRALAWDCQQFTPFVSTEQFDGVAVLVMDMTGGTHLFGGEHALARRVVLFLAARGFYIHLAIASSVGAAWAIARYGHRAGASRRLRFLPVEALRLPVDVLERLHAFGLYQIDQVLQLPRRELPARFGEVLPKRVDQLFGRQDEVLVPERRPDPVCASWSSEESISGQASVLYVCRQLLQEVIATVHERREGILRLQFCFRGEAAEPVCFEQGLVQPSDSVEHLLKLLTIRLERERLPERLHTVQVKVTAATLLEVRQHQLFGHDETRADESFHRLLEQLSTRLGDEAVSQPTLLPEPLPEEAVAYGPVLQRSGKATRFGESSDEDLFVSSRPLRLLHPPVAIRVVSVVPDGPPIRFSWNTCDYTIARCTELERITTGWWKDSGTIARDYFQVEATTGARFWLFRDREGQWFLHGLFE